MQARACSQSVPVVGWMLCECNGGWGGEVVRLTWDFVVMVVIVVFRCNLGE